MGGGHVRRRPTQLPKPGGQAGDEATASASLTHSSRPLPRERQTLRPVRTQPRGGPFREEQTSLGPFPGPPSPIASVQSGHRPSCVPAPLPAPDVHQLLSLPPAPLVLGDSPEVPGPEAQAVTQRHRPPPPGLGQPKLRGSRQKPQSSSSRQGTGTETPSIRPTLGSLGS